MNAQLAERVAGIMISLGSIPSTIEAVANMGNSKLVMAEFDVSSVMNVTKMQIIATTRSGCTAGRSAKIRPMSIDKPESSTPPAMANPPPNRNRIPHGISLAFLHVSNDFPLFFFDGVRNNNADVAIATALSVKYGRFNQ